MFGEIELHVRSLRGDPDRPSTAGTRGARAKLKRPATAGSLRAGGRRAASGRLPVAGQVSLGRRDLTPVAAAFAAVLLRGNFAASSVAVAFSSDEAGLLAASLLAEGIGHIEHGEVNGCVLPLAKLGGDRDAEELALVSPKGQLTPVAVHVACEVMRLSGRPPRSLTLRRNCLGTIGAAAVSRLLHATTTPTVLNLADCKLRDDGLSSLKEAVLVSGVVELNLSRNFLSVRAVDSFARMLVARNMSGKRLALRRLLVDLSPLDIRAILGPPLGWAPAAVAGVPDTGGSPIEPGVPAFVPSQRARSLARRSQTWTAGVRRGATGGGSSFSTRQQATPREAGAALEGDEMDDVAVGSTDGIDDADAELEATADKDFPRRLDFSRADLHTLDLAVLATALRANERVTQLILDKQRFTRVPPRDVLSCVDKIADILRCNRLRSLSMRAMKMGTECMNMVLRPLSREATSLTELFIDQNDMNSPGGVALGRMLGANRNLITVTAADNGFSLGAVKHIAREVRSNDCLQFLRFERFVIPCQDIIGRTGKRTLNFSCKRLGLKDIVFISAMLESNVVTEVLNVSGNSAISATATEYLAAACRENYTLRQLRMGYTSLPVQELAGHGTEESVDLSSQRLTAVDVAYITEALRYNSVLTELSLRSTDMPPNSVSEMSSCLGTNTSLKRLDISRNPRLSQRSYRTLAHALLEAGAHLQTLIVHKLELPVQQLIGTDPSATVVKLSTDDYSDADAICVAEWVRANSVMLDLDLHECQLEPQQVVWLAQSLKSGPNLSIRTVRFDELLAIPVPGFLGVSTTTEAILHSVPGQPLSKSTIAFISTCLERNEALEFLQFTEDTLGAHEVAPIVASLRSNTVLHTLTLQKRPIPVQALLGHAQREHLSLATEHSDIPPLSDVDVSAVSSLLASETSVVETLDLSSNGLTGTQVVAMMRENLLSETCRLKTIILSDNSIEMDEVRDICDVLREPTLTTTLTTLRFDDEALPVRQLLGTSAEDRIHFTDAGFSARDLVLVGDLLATNTSVRSLRLRNSNVLANQRDIAAGIHGCSGDLLACDLSHNDLGRDVRGLKVTLRTLTDDQAVRTLSLAGNMIGRNFSAVATLIERNVFLASLDVSFNKIDVEGCRQLAQALARNTTLLTLRMASVDLTHEALETLLEVPWSITSLDLSKNDATLGAHSIARLVELLDVQREMMNLRVGRLTMPVPTLIGDTAVEKLDYFKNEQLVLPEVVFVSHCLAKRNDRVRIADFSGTSIDDDGAAAISEMLKATTTLTELSLRGCQISDVGALVLADGLASNHTLVSLDFRDNPVKAEGLTYLCVCLEENRVLKDLVVSGHQGGPEAEPLEAALEAVLAFNRRWEPVVDEESGLVKSGVRSYDNGDSLVVQNGEVSEFVARTSMYRFSAKRSWYAWAAMLVSVIATLVDDWLMLTLAALAVYAGHFGRAAVLLCIRVISTAVKLRWLRQVGRLSNWLLELACLSVLVETVRVKLGSLTDAVIDLRDPVPYVGDEYVAALTLRHAVSSGLPHFVVSCYWLLEDVERDNLEVMLVTFGFVVSFVSATFGMALADRHEFHLRRFVFKLLRGDRSTCDHMVPVCRHVDLDFSAMLAFRSAEVWSRAWTWATIALIEEVYAVAAICASFVLVWANWTSARPTLMQRIRFLTERKGDNLGVVLLGLVHYPGFTNTWYSPWFGSRNESERWDSTWSIGSRVVDQTAVSTIVYLLGDREWMAVLGFISTVSGIHRAQSELLCLTLLYVCASNTLRIAQGVMVCTFIIHMQRARADFNRSNATVAPMRRKRRRRKKRKRKAAAAGATTVPNGPTMSGDAELSAMALGQGSLDSAGAAAGGAAYAADDGNASVGGTGSTPSYTDSDEDDAFMSESDDENVVAYEDVP